MFWEDVQVTLALWNSNGGWTVSFNLQLKMTFWACLVVSGSKFIFHCIVQLLILSILSNITVVHNSVGRHVKNDCCQVVKYLCLFEIHKKPYLTRLSNGVK